MPTKQGVLGSVEFQNVRGHILRKFCGETFLDIFVSRRGGGGRGEVRRCEEIETSAGINLERSLGPGNVATYVRCCVPKRAGGTVRISNPPRTCVVPLREYAVAPLPIGASFQLLLPGTATNRAHHILTHTHIPVLYSITRKTGVLLLVAVVTCLMFTCNYENKQGRPKTCVE